MKGCKCSMRGKYKLQYHLVETNTQEIINPGDRVVVTTVTPYGYIDGIVKSFPSGCLKLMSGVEEKLIPLGNIEKIEKKSKKIYVLMEQDSLDSMFSQYDIMGTTYEKSEALKWIEGNYEYRTYRETKAPK